MVDPIYENILKAKTICSGTNWSYKELEVENGTIDFLLIAPPYQGTSIVQYDVMQKIISDVYIHHKKHLTPLYMLGTARIMDKIYRSGMLIYAAKHHQSAVYLLTADIDDDKTNVDLLAAALAKSISSMITDNILIVLSNSLEIEGADQIIERKTIEQAMDNLSTQEYLVYNNNSFIVLSDVKGILDKE